MPCVSLKATFVSLWTLAFNYERIIFKKINNFLFFSKDDDELQNCDNCDQNFEGFHNFKQHLKDSKSCNEALKSLNLKKGPKFKTKVCDTCDKVQ